MEIKTTIFALTLVIVLAWRNVKLSRLAGKESKYGDILYLMKINMKNWKNLWRKARKKS
jgi:hypothetical protein